MPEELGTWLRQQREARGWTKREMARQLIQAAQATGDKSVPGMDSMCHNIHRWENGQGGLTERYRLHYCKALGIPPSQFGTGQAQPIMTGSATSALAISAPPASAAPGLANPRLLVSAAVAYRGLKESDMGDSMVEREVLMAAHDGSDHAEQAEEHGIGEATFEQLRADVVRLSQLTDAGEPFTVFLDMRRVRDRIYRLLDRRLWPREQTDLFFLLGCLNDFMGSTAIRLGYPDAAEELIRAGWAYANAIDHRPLLGHMRAQLSNIMYWQGRLRDSRDLAENGLEYVSKGPPGADLHVNYARAAARMGDADAARQAIAHAHDARERDYHDDLLEIGGDFVISLATHHCMAGGALADIGDAEREAAEELERAITLYDEGPRPREQHWFAGKPLAGIDLAVIRLRSGALDAAISALDSTLLLPAGQRITQVTSRLMLVRDELAAPIFRGSVQAQALSEQIEEFGRETIVTGLHSLPGGPT